MQMAIQVPSCPLSLLWTGGAGTTALYPFPVQNTAWDSTLDQQVHWQEMREGKTLGMQTGENIRQLKCYTKMSEKIFFSFFGGKVCIFASEHKIALILSHLSIAAEFWASYAMIATQILSSPCHSFSCIILSLISNVHNNTPHQFFEINRF